MFYREILPRMELQAYIKCFWFLEAPANLNAPVERIIPDGRMEMIFHYGGNFQELNESGTTAQSCSTLAGQIREAILIRPVGAVGMLAVRFLPNGFSSLFAIPANELSYQMFNLDDVLGSTGKALEEEILNAPTNALRIQILENFFLKQLSSHDNFDVRISTIVQRIYQLRGVFRLDGLAHEFNLSTRQLERLFQAKIGLSPNLFGRLVRFRNALSLKLTHSAMNIADLSQACGYYDQSHFVKDFKDFSGLTPRQYFCDVHQMSDFFSDPP